MVRVALWAMVTAVALLSQPSSANATPIVAGTWYEFGYDGAGTPLRACPTCTPGTNAPGGEPILFVLDDPWEITTTDASQTLIVLDGFIAGDRFELFDSASLGMTSLPAPPGSCLGDIACAFANPAFSQAIFPLAIGAHSFTGRQVLGSDGAGFLMVTAPSAVPAVPEPATLVLMGSGLLAAIARLRWRRSARRAA